MTQLTSDIARVAYVRHMVTTDAKFAGRAVVALHVRTQARKDGETKWNTGFNQRDHDVLSAIAEECLSKKHLRQAQFDILKKKLPKYAGQLVGLMSIRKKMESQ